MKLILGAVLLLLMAGCGVMLQTSAVDLRTFIGCAVREFTFLAKKPGCRALRVTTDACWGRCETWEAQGDSPGLVCSGRCQVTPDRFHRHEDKDPVSDHKPVPEPPYVESYHRVCTYNETKMVTVKLPKCAPDVDPFYTYPVAIRCDCDICSTATTECETA